MAIRRPSAKANAETRLSSEAAKTGDDYILTTLLMAAALFLAGWRHRSGRDRHGIVLIAASAVVLALAAARLIDLPVA